MKRGVRHLSVSAASEQTRQALSRTQRPAWLESLARDLRYSLRTLAKHPAVTAIAILSIGLGIGANATIFSMVSRFVLRPVPVGDPSTLLALHTVHDGDQCCNSFSLPVYNDVRDQAKSFSSVAAYYELLPASVGGSGEPERVWGQGATSNFFAALELPMMVGRGFVSGEDRAAVVVLGANLWRRRFNGGKDIVGKTILLSGRSFTVIGVAPASFRSVDQLLISEFWVPLGQVANLAPNLPDQSARDQHWIEVVARLAPGVSNNDAGAELKTLAARFAKAYPKTDKGNGFAFEQAGTLPSNARGMVLIFFTASTIVALLVLSIAGANVANLLFAQAAARQREMAVRLALGATRSGLRNQVLMESLLLGLGGGVLGVALSFAATRGLSSISLPAPVPLDASVAVDWRVLLYSFALSVLCGLILGLAPAWAASRPLLANALKGEDALARPGRRFSLRNFLIIVQVGMSVILLCVTGLFLRSLESAAGITLGFRSHNLLMMSIDPRVNGYTPERSVAFFTELERSVSAIPGVQSAIVTDSVPLNGGFRSDGFTVDGETANGKNQDPAITELFMVTPPYFETLGIPLLAGRNFGAETANGPRTAIVNQAFVEHLLPGQNPIGRHVSGGGATYEIIGISGNVKARTLGEDTRPVLYRSLTQNIARDPSVMGYTLVVHTSGNPSALAESVRRQVYALDPAMAIYNGETMEEHVRTAYFLPRLAATLFGVFGGIGLVLASIGLYGVMSYAVSRRTREIGIRMALGAKPGSVERLILRQGMVLTLIAIAIGWPAAWMLAKMAASFLYGIQPHDAVTFTIVPPLLAAIAFAACWIPARRAAQVDPMRALRTE